MNEFTQNEQTETTPLTAPTPAMPMPPQTPPKVRRVGTFTMGLALIGTGVLIALAMMLPAFDLTWALRLCPALLVLLGCEVLFYSFQKTDAKIKYDWLSMFVCFILVVSSLCLALVPNLLQYYGPERELVQNRLSRELDDTCYDLLGDEKSVLNCQSSVYFSEMEFDRNATLDFLSSSPDLTFSSIYVELTGSYAKGDTAAFAADAARVLAKLSQSEYRFDRIVLDWNRSSDGLDHSMRLEVSGRFLENKTAAELAPLVNENYYDRAAEESAALEQERASQYEEGHSVGYQEGYDAAMNEQNGIVSAPTGNELPASRPEAEVASGFNP